METKHTPAPWSIDQYRNILGADGHLLVVTGVATPIGPRNQQSEANAAHIVRCVNSHEQMRRALEEVLAVCQDRQAFVMQGPRAFAKAEQIARAALSAAGKE